tara:strand:- start:207 stop:536 length:330 start_codon:yes stop_codon:yes gene_type:complete
MPQPAPPVTHYVRKPQAPLGPLDPLFHVNWQGMLIKRFLQLMPEPLFPYKLFELFTFSVSAPQRRDSPPPTSHAFALEGILSREVECSRKVLMYSPLVILGYFLLIVID